MHLFKDLRSTSPRRSAAVVLFVLLASAGQAVAASLAGPVLADRSVTAFVVLAIALVVSASGDLVIGLLVARLTADWSAAVRRRLCGVALGQEIPTLESTPVGELIDRIDNDVYQVGSQVRGSGLQMVRAGATGGMSVIAALLVWWPAGLVMALAGPLLALALRGKVRRIGAARLAEEEAWSDVAAVTEEAVHGQDDVRTSLAQPYVLRLAADRAARTLERGRVGWRLCAGVMVEASVVVRGGIALTVVAATWALATGHTDAARLTSVWLLGLAFGGTVEQIGRMLPDVQYGLGAWARVRLLAAAPVEPTGGATPADGPLEVRDLTFRYPGAGAPALRGVTLTFCPGRTYAIIGRSGSGKSTLAKVLTRAVDLPRGAVTLAGTDLGDLDVERLRRWIAVVPQRTEILAGTLAENVALFDPALLPRVADAVTELGLSDWVAELPGGLATRLGDGGHVLSAGQEQLVALARILVRDPHVVILDEATARLDPVTEARVHRATERVMTDRIGVVIAHRLSSVRRCDDVIVLADGAVVEAGPLARSHTYSRLVDGALVDRIASDPPAADRSAEDRSAEDLGAPGGDRPGRTDRPPVPTPPPAHTLREIFRLVTNDPGYGLGALGVFALMVVCGLDGSVLAWLWAALTAGRHPSLGAAAGIVALLVLMMPMPWFVGRWFPEWWTRQMLRIGVRLVHGQTGPRRVSGYTPAEVVAQAGDTERVVILADNVVDQIISLVVVVAMTVVTRSVVPALFFVATMIASALAALAFAPALERLAAATVVARAAFATALASALSAARTVKLAGATEPVLDHLARLDALRSDRQRREVSAQVRARSTPSLASGILPIAVWAVYLTGGLTRGGALVAVATLGSARWFAWTTASLISQLPSARVWTRRTVAMCGAAAYASTVPGVDLSAGTAPAPPAPARHPLRRLEIAGFEAVHEDGTVGVSGVDLTVERGRLVLVTGAVGSGKSSLLRALAGIVHHRGTLLWNGSPIVDPQLFLRPAQVGYVAQMPRVLSGTVADNIRLGRDLDAAAAVSTARLEYDLAASGSGLGLLIGHRGIHLSGGQLQRLALARALAPNTELLIADDISSALDVTTELELWRALREHGVTVIGSTSKRTALARADLVLVLAAGRPVARGPWHLLESDWGHLAG